LNLTETVTWVPYDPKSPPPEGVDLVIRTEEQWPSGTKWVDFHGAHWNGRGFEGDSDFLYSNVTHWAFIQGPR
jgi:hypothetical protein